MVHIAGLVLRHVGDGAREGISVVEVRGDALRILAHGHHEPPADVLRDLPGGGSGCAQPPYACGVVEACGDDGLAEAGPYVEAGGVGLEVGDELVLSGVLGVGIGERHAGELAEALGEVEAEAVVGAPLPQRRDAVGAVQHDEGHVATDRPAGPALTMMGPFTRMVCAGIGMGVDGWMDGSIS